MITYISAFIFYTLAMIGVMLVGFVVYKKTFATTKSENNGSMKILDSLQIAPKKNLLIVKVRNEKFLIASGLEHTTFLAKLEDESKALKDILKSTEEQNKISVGEPRMQSIKQEFMTKYSENEVQQKPSVNPQQERLDKIQQQFKELWEMEPEPNFKEQNTQRQNLQNQNLQGPTPLAMSKRDQVKKLIKDLNETTSYNVGNRY